MSDPSQPSGMGLYADLLADPNKKSSSTISGAPVRYNLKALEGASPAPKQRDASLQFQPGIRRPQQRPKTKSHAWPGTAPPFAAAKPDSTSAAGSTIEYWLEKGNDHKYVRPKPKWWKEKKSKKKLQEEKVQQQNWDDIYDPTRPNLYRVYKGSEEQYREISAWKDRLYCRAKGGRGKSFEEPSRSYNPMFAPPAFDAPSSGAAIASTSPVPTTYDDATGEEAFARRARMAAFQMPTYARDAPPAQPISTQTPSEPALSADQEAKRAAAFAKIAALKAKIQADKTAPTASTQGHEASDQSTSPPADHSSTAGLGSTITRAPVRYDIPKATSPPSQDAQQALPSEAPFNIFKGGFGKRMLEKHGWKEGQGLGAKNEGITTPISVRPEKRKKLADSEGGGWAGPANLGKIIGGKRRKVEGEEPETVMSNVIKIPGMLRGLDVKQEIEEKNLMQELGDWFDENCGTVERIFIWQEDQGGDNEVFIKFTNPISALKAVNPNDILTFANNEVKARYFDATKFDKGEYT